MSEINYVFTDLFGGYDFLYDSLILKYNYVKDRESNLLEGYRKSFSNISKELGFDFDAYQLVDSEEYNLLLYEFLVKLFVPEVGNAKTNFGEILRSLNYLRNVHDYFMRDGKYDSDQGFKLIKNKINYEFNNLDFLLLQSNVSVIDPFKIHGELPLKFCRDEDNCKFKLVIHPDNINILERITNKLLDFFNKFNPIYPMVKDSNSMYYNGCVLRNLEWFDMEFKID